MNCYEPYTPCHGPQRQMGRLLPGKKGCLPFFGSLLRDGRILLYTQNNTPTGQKGRVPPYGEQEGGPIDKVIEPHVKFFIFFEYIYVYLLLMPFGTI